MKTTFNEIKNQSHFTKLVWQMVIHIKIHHEDHDGYLAADLENFVLAIYKLQYVQWIYLTVSKILHPSNLTNSYFNHEWKVVLPIY